MTWTEIIIYLMWWFVSRTAMFYFLGAPQNTDESGILWTLVPGILELFTVVFIGILLLLVVFAIPITVVVGIMATPMFLGLWLRKLVSSWEPKSQEDQ
jgi:hypothetical protein